MPTGMQSVYKYKEGMVQYALYLPDTAAKAAPLNFCYLWVDAVPEGEPSLEQAWASNGLYTFIHFNDTPDYANIAAGLYSLYKVYKSDSLRFIWVDDDATTQIAGISVDGDEVTAGNNFVFSQMELAFPASCKIAPSADYSAFTFTGDGFNFKPDKYNWEVSDIPATSDITLSLTGDAQGVFSFSMDADATQLGACNAGLHYYYSEDKVSEDGGLPQTWYTALNYPILKPASPLKLQVLLDFRNPLDALRTKIQIAGGDNIPSLISTTTGHFLQLKPENTAGSFSGFTLVNHPKDLQETGLLCFNLEGSFRIAQPQGKRQSNELAPKQLLCGLSGTEHIEVLPQGGSYQGDLIDFIPGKPAYAPAFSLNADSADDKAETSLLAENDYCSTSWLQIRKAADAPAQQKINNYYTQPQDSPLFAKDGAKSKFLNLYPAQAGYTYNANVADGALKCFPMVPYGAVDGAESALVKFERQILSKKRKQLIVTEADIKAKDDEYKKQTDIAKGPLTTTPQGLLVRVNEYNGVQKWSELITAVNNLYTPSSGGPWIKVENVSATLQSAFQTNQQFLVVSKKDSFGKTIDGAPKSKEQEFLNLMYVANWPFYINIGKNNYGDFSNVMIYKFCAGTVVDMAKNTSGWTQANDFVGEDDVPSLSRWLENYFNNVDALYEKEPSYTYIHKIIHDPNWNGVLALNVDVGLNNFPADLKGLLGGMDTSRFKAHHWGVEVNTITLDANGQVKVPACSSMFALIDYNDDGKVVPSEKEVDYDFKVLKLQVLFKNSAIIEFNSNVKLTVNKLFGDAVKFDTDAEGKNLPSFILLDGTYENHNGHNTYIFNAREKKVFNLQSNALKTVEFEKVQFTTLKSGTDSKDTSVESRFAIWGKMSLNNLAALDDSLFDALSFDKLAYSNLGIKMDFDTTNPSERKFTFDNSALAFDTANSQARKGSLVMNFPVSLTGLLTGEDTKLPKDSNFLNVISPLDALSQSFSTPWCGLSFDLNLGSAGALASKGGFTGKLLVAWCTGTPPEDDNEFAVSLFLQLPGAGASGGGINLQSVFKLAVGGITLHVNTDKTNPEKVKTSYLLKFNKIVIDVLGKKLPPKGKMEFFLFGNPDKVDQVADTKSSLGWYAAYQKDKEEKKEEEKEEAES